MISKSKTILSLFLGIFLIISLGNCKKEKESIKVGVVLSLTGVIAPYGQNALNGLELAVSELNEKNGIDGKKVEIIIEDDNSDPKTATLAVQKLITQNKIKVAIGFIGSSQLLASAPLFEKNKVILISPGASSPQIRDAGEYIFRTRASGDLEARTLARFAVNKLDCKSIAVLYVNNDYGLSWMKTFRDEAISLGGKIVAMEAFLQNSNDLRSQLSAIKIANPSCLLILGYLNEIALSLRQSTELGLNVTKLTTVGIQDKQIFVLAKESAQNVYFATIDYDLNNPDTFAFDKKYNNKFGKPSDIFAANSYDAMNIIARAIASVGLYPNKIQNYLLSLRDYPGVGGKISFDENGDVIKSVKIKQVKGNDFIETLF